MNELTSRPAKPLNQISTALDLLEALDPSHQRKNGAAS
jgi:hypothetical protein